MLKKLRQKKIRQNEKKNVKAFYRQEARNIH